MDWKIKKKAILYSLVLIIIGSLIVTATYAVLLAILQGGIIEVVGLEGGISYSTDGINWTSIGGNLYNIPLGTSIFCRIEVTGSGYSGDVTITWKLLLSNVELYTLANYTTTNLTGNIGQIIYCSPNGANASLFDWGTQMTTAGTYSILAEVWTI